MLEQLLETLKGGMTDLNVYRHFKGGVYLVQGICKDAINGEDVVVYQSLKDYQVWTRPLSQFADDVSEREDNITGQKTRMEKVKIDIDFISTFSTKSLIEELKKRNDNPYELVVNSDRTIDSYYRIGKKEVRLAYHKSPGEDRIEVSKETLKISATTDKFEDIPKLIEAAGITKDLGVHKVIIQDVSDFDFNP